MRRIVCQEWGPPEQLVVVEGPDPVPGPGQVVVAVAAAGVNFVDALLRGRHLPDHAAAVHARKRAGGPGGRGG
ncbi:MAG: hypothetical protein R2746_13780 [Acidimicrobiales bacterium]